MPSRRFNDGQHVSVFRTIPLFMPAVAFVTIWWLLGFNVLLFIAGLRNISTRDLRGGGARRRRALGAVHAHHLAADLAGHGAGVHDPAHPAVQDLRPGLSVRRLGGRVDPTMVMVQYIYKQAFQMNKGGLAAAASLVLFLLIVVLSVLQYPAVAREGRR